MDILGVAFNAEREPCEMIVEELIPFEGDSGIYRGKRPLSRMTWSHVGYEVVLGLEFLESQNVVHRDLKPANLLITRKMHVKIGDFGTARFYSELSTKQTTAMGTPVYMGPDRKRGEPPSSATDRFSFGVMMIELATGRDPSPSGVEHTADGRVIEEITRRADDLTQLGHHLPHASGIIEKCLRNESAKRATTKELKEFFARTVLDDWEDLMQRPAYLSHIDVWCILAGLRERKNDADNDYAACFLHFIENRFGLDIHPQNTNDNAQILAFILKHICPALNDEAKALVTVRSMRRWQERHLTRSPTTQQLCIGVLCGLCTTANLELRRECWAYLAEILSRYAAGTHWTNLWQLVLIDLRHDEFSDLLIKCATLLLHRWHKVADTPQNSETFVLIARGVPRFRGNRELTTLGLMSLETLLKMDLGEIPDVVPLLHGILVYVSDFDEYHFYRSALAICATTTSRVCSDVGDDWAAALLVAIVNALEKFPDDAPIKREGCNAILKILQLGSKYALKPLAIALPLCVHVARTVVAATKTRAIYEYQARELGRECLLLIGPEALCDTSVVFDAREIILTERLELLRRLPWDSNEDTYRSRLTLRALTTILAMLRSAAVTISPEDMTMMWEAVCRQQSRYREMMIVFCQIIIIAPDIVARDTFIGLCRSIVDRKIVIDCIMAEICLRMFLTLRLSRDHGKIVLVVVEYVMTTFPASPQVQILGCRFITSFYPYLNNRPFWFSMFITDKEETKLALKCLDRVFFAFSRGVLEVKQAAAETLDVCYQSGVSREKEERDLEGDILTVMEECDSDASMQARCCSILAVMHENERNPVNRLYSGVKLIARAAIAMESHFRVAEVQKNGLKLIICCQEQLNESFLVCGSGVDQLLRVLSEYGQDADLVADVLFVLHGLSVNAAARSVCLAGGAVKIIMTVLLYHAENARW